MFQLSDYINSDEELDTPENVVLCCLSAYKKWSKDCASWAKANKHHVSELAKGPAKDCHLQIRKRYCAPLNRRWHRSHSGYYFLGGIVESEGTVLKSIQLSSKEVEIYTAFKNNKNKTFRFHVVRQGRRWLIKSVLRDDGNGWWTEEFL